MEDGYNKNVGVISQADNVTNVVPHEIGHFLEMSDRYDEEENENDIMGNTRVRNLVQSHYDDFGELGSNVLIGGNIFFIIKKLFDGHRKSSSYKKEEERK